MKALATLIDRLTVTPKPEHQITLISDYLRLTAGPDRGFALAALTGAWGPRVIRPAKLREWMAQRVDPVLLETSLDYVGDLTETVSLLWPKSQANRPPPSLSEISQTLAENPKPEIEDAVLRWLDACEPATRYALLRLLSGGLRSSLSAQTVKAGVAALSATVSVGQVEEVWHALTPPYADLFAWIEGRGPRPDTHGVPTFRPVMRGPTVQAPDLLETKLIAEYKWTGARVQWVQAQGQVRLYSGDGDDLTAAFPELTQPLTQDGVLDGQLMVYRDGKPGTAEDLSRRMRRKTVTAALLKDLPAHARFFDMLEHKGADMREFALSERRARLEVFGAENALDLSPLLPLETLKTLHQNLSDVEGAEGIILKRADRPYTAGRSADDWLKWSREALRFHAVLLYVQRASGGANAAFTEFTLGAITDEDENGNLIPIGKVSPRGLSPDELAQINAYARENTLQRFGPVRSIRAGLVLEIACEGVEASRRRKSGLRLKSPSAVKLQSDMAWQDANTLKSLLRLIA